MNFKIEIGQTVNIGLFTALESYACPTGWDSDSRFSDTDGYIIDGKYAVITAWSTIKDDHVVIYKASLEDANKDRFDLRIYLMDPEGNSDHLTDSERIEKALEIMGCEADPIELIPILDLLSRMCGYARAKGWLK